MTARVLPPDLRRADILERVQRDGRVSLSDLVNDYAVSPVTVHRDLDLLSSGGLIERVRGGARAVPESRAPIETAWSARMRQAGPQKDAIARQARARIADGSAIFLDASTTALALVRQLELKPPRELTVVTNSPAIALGITAESVHVIVTPGELDQQMRVLTGRWTVEFLRELTVATAFVSASGFTADGGLSTSRTAVADAVKAAISIADQTVALIDSTKFGRSSLMKIADLSELDLVITDDALEPQTAEEFRQAGINLELALTHPDP